MTDQVPSILVKVLEKIGPGKTVKVTTKVNIITKGYGKILTPVYLRVRK